MVIALVILAGIAIAALAAVVVMLALRRQPNVNLELLRMYERIANAGQAPDAFSQAQIDAQRDLAFRQAELAVLGGDVTQKEVPFDEREQVTVID